MDFKKVQSHNHKDACWLVIHGKVYDLTEFKDIHPGGSKIILKQAGKDATSQFKMYHPPDLMEKLLERKYHLGPVDLQTLPSQSKDMQRDERKIKMPALSSVLNMFDFENLARQVLSPEAWGYYSSAGDDEITLRENHAAFHRIWFKPRVLVNVAKVDTTTKMFGTLVDLPVYITATALGRLNSNCREIRTS
jgi:L-lactate dehydrogenase (cytochrome)